MTFTFLELTEDCEEIEVSSWKEATHCIIDCEQGNKELDLLQAGLWIQKNKKTIADYSLMEPKSDCPYIEIYKKKH